MSDSTLPYATSTCTVGFMYLFLPALTPILVLITCTQRNTTPYVVVCGVELFSDTFTLSWEYHYSGIRLVGLCGGGTVIQCIKEGCRSPEHCIWYHWSRTCSGSFDHVYATPTTHHSSLTPWKHRENGVYEIVIRICMVSGK